MAQSMKKVTELGAELSNEERNLLSVAYKVRGWLCDLRDFGLVWLIGKSLVWIMAILECCRSKTFFVASDFLY